MGTLAKAKFRWVVPFALLGGALLLIGVWTAEAKAAPAPFWERCQTGSGAGQCRTPTGVATNPDTGHIFIAEQNNQRVAEFDAWGIFVRAWGWDVAPEGTAGDTPADQFETCPNPTPGEPPPANGCKTGLEGSGAGQFAHPQGVAIDSNGDLYVADLSNLRAQKFDPEGNFLSMFGGEVNQTKVGEGAPEGEQNRCPVDPGDVCKIGTFGAGQGQFRWPEVGNFISVAPDGLEETIYVGDKDRIQEFTPTGTYKGEIAQPGETVQSLATGPTGELYVAYFLSGSLGSKANARKLNPDGSEACPMAVGNPRGIATDPEGDVFVFDSGAVAAGPLLEFEDSNCVAKGTPFGGGEFDLGTTGIGTSGACGLWPSDFHLYAGKAHPSNSFVKAFSLPGPAVKLPDPNLCPPPQIPPQITAQHAVSVDTETATLRAQVNPFFWDDTTFFVQYGTADCKTSPTACETKALFPGADLGEPAGEFLATAPVFLSGLQPGTTYFYRFVSQSSGSGGEPVFGEGEEACALDPECGEGASFTTFPKPSAAKSDCPNQGFRNDGDSAHLPDCRAYELVSPLDKESGDITGGGNGLEQGASDGEALTYSALRAFADPEAAPAISQYLARRDAQAGEWVSESIQPPREGSRFHEFADLETHFKAFSSDLCQGWILHGTEPLLDEGSIPGKLPNLYRRENCTEPASYEALSRGEAPADIQRSIVFIPAIQGFSADGSVSVFRVPGQLREDLPACPLADEEANICPRRVYAAHDEQMTLISVLPEGTPSGARENSVGTSQGKLPATNKPNSLFRAVSADGSRVYWTASGDIPTGALYVRLNPTAAETTEDDPGGDCIPDPVLACTVQVAEANDIRFWSAALDGSKAVYSVGDLISGASLHIFDLATQTSTPIADEVLGVAGASEDASRIYFASREALDAGAVAGEPNLYLYEADEGGTSYAFVATLAEADVQVGSFSPVSLRPDLRVSRVTPDGSHLAFTSTAPITGYDNADVEGGEAAAEVFLYDAGAEELACVSCNPSGARPQARQVPGAIFAAGTLTPWTHQLHPSRALSEDGGRLFFESYDSLVLADTNSGRKDVYEWEEAASAAECGPAAKGAELYVPAAGGCLSLISSGTSTLDSEFLDASTTGRDVFIRTASSLLPHDPDLVDVYDARELGGLPLPPPPKEVCEGESCQNPSPPPPEITPGSSTFQGPGNAAPKGKARRCPKGKRRVKRGGKVRCLAKGKGKRRSRKAGR